MAKTPHIPTRTKMGTMTPKGEMSRAEHMEHHCSDGQRHAEGRYKVANQEMHDSFANEKKYHGK